MVCQVQQKLSLPWKASKLLQIDIKYQINATLLEINSTLLEINTTLFKTLKSIKCPYLQKKKNL